MATEIWDNFVAVVRGEPPSGRLGQVALGLYLLACAASVAWATSGGSPQNQVLGAAVRWHHDDLAAPSLSVTNESREDWTNVQVILDHRYYYDLGQLQKRRTVLVTMERFEDGHVLPRPGGLYPYERLLGQAPSIERNSLPPWYRPTTVDIKTDQGRFTADEILQ